MVGKYFRGDGRTRLRTADVPTHPARNRPTQRGEHAQNLTPFKDSSSPKKMPSASQVVAGVAHRTLAAPKPKVTKPHPAPSEHDALGRLSGGQPNLSITDSQFASVPSLPAYE